MDYATLTDVRLTVNDGQIFLALPQATLVTLLAGFDPDDCDQPNARRAFRVLIRDWMEVTASLIDEENEISVQMRDISLSGFEVFLPSDDLRLPTNREIGLRIQTGSRSAEIPARLIRLGGESIAFRFSHAYMSGKFESPRELELIIMDLQRQWVAHNGYASQFSEPPTSS